MSTPRIEEENHSLRHVVPQDVAAKIIRNQKVLDGMGDFTFDQVTLAGRVVSILVMRRTLEREDAKRMTPRGLAAIASLIRPSTETIEQVIADGVLRKALALLSRGLVPAPTASRAALTKATIAVPQRVASG